jgi:hypothetical protein
MIGQKENAPMPVRGIEEIVEFLREHFRWEGKQQL